MNIDLAGRTALVTGSTAGIGRAIAAGLATSGAEVIVNGRTDERVDAAVQELADQTGGSVRGVAADIGTAEGCTSLAEQAGEVDILVNNAGIFEPEPVLEISDDKWLSTFETNVMSGVRLCRALVPAMVARGWGRVIFISSESAVQIPAEMVDYGVSKASQLAVARGLAESLPESGVTVNSVLPGPTLSEGLAEMLADQASEGQSIDEVGREFVKAERPTTLIGRPADPEEVANLVVYVASPQASATTGAALRVDGGVVRAIP